MKLKGEGRCKLAGLKHLIVPVCARGMCSMDTSSSQLQCSQQITPIQAVDSEIEHISPFQFTYQCTYSDTYVHVRDYPQLS